MKRAPCAAWSLLAALLGLSAAACQPPLPATACGGDPECPPGARCFLELGVCVVEDAGTVEDAMAATDR